MLKPKSLTYNDFYDTLMETFIDLEHEFVDKEEYESAGLMLEAQKELKYDKELNDLLNGNNVVYPSRRTKTGNKGI